MRENWWQQIDQRKYKNYVLLQVHIPHYLLFQKTPQKLYLKYYDKNYI